MKKIYRESKNVLTAAQKKLGGRLAVVDGVYVLHLVEKNLSGRLVDTYLFDDEAAARADLDFRPPGREWEW